MKASLPKPAPGVGERSLVEAVREEEEGLERESRPVAVGEAHEPEAFDDLVADADADAGDDAPDAEESRPVSDVAMPDLEDRSRDELIAGVAAFVLAVSTFLPWYRTASVADPATVSGWASGTWGPLIAFLGLAAAAIVGLRRARVPVAFPLGTPLVIEGIGWVSVVGLVLKNWYIPDATFGIGQLERAPGLWISMGLAFAVAMIAGRVSRDTPVMLIPGWLKGAGGKTGTAVLALALAGGVFFGLTNDVGGVSPSGRTGLGVPNHKTVSGRAPECVKRFNLPVPEGMKAVSGSEIAPGAAAQEFCQVVLETKISASKASFRYRNALKKAGYEYKSFSSAGSRALQITAPRCGYVTVTDAKSKRTVQVVIVGSGACPSQSPSP